MDLIKKTTKKKTPSDKKSAANSDAFKKLKLLVTVVNRSKTEFYTDLITTFDVNLQVSVLAQGTASSDAKYMLGLDNSDKSVIFSVLREEKTEEALQTLEDKFHAIKNGKGIAFTIPLSSVIGVAIYRFLSNHRA